MVKENTPSLFSVCFPVFDSMINIILLNFLIVSKLSTNNNNFVVEISNCRKWCIYLQILLVIKTESKINTLCLDVGGIDGFN